MDYDQTDIATSYDKARALAPETRQLWQDFVEKSALRADSFLARLPDADFHEGMAGLRTHGAEIDPNDAVTEEVDWFVFVMSP